MKLEFKMEWIVGLAAFIVGAGGGTGVTWAIMRKQEPTIVETNKVVEKMVEVDLSLTETDLLKTPCSADFIDKHGESLCREMFCRMNTRSGNQANSASQKECESISNIINSELIIKKCFATKYVGPHDPNPEENSEEQLRIDRENCIRVFEKRK